MTEPKSAKIKTLNGELFISIRTLAHPKDADQKAVYLSFSNGMDVAGVYLDKNTQKEIVEFLSEKKRPGRPANK